MNTNPRALFLSHGGGPLPLLGDPGHREMVACLERLPERFHKPAALLVISAHWEESRPTITAGENPPLIYDYYGFPEASYEIEYPCRGAPTLAREVHQLLEQAGIPSHLDETRGLDHGVFVPLKIMYPEADIPCVQLSLVNTLDPKKHIEMGLALHTLSQQNVLVIGSGFTFHNMRAFFKPDTAQSKGLNHAFETWLRATCSDTDLTEEERAQRLIQWSHAEGARYCHPREEHLLPLHVCYGAAQAACTEQFGLEILNKETSVFLW